MDFPFILIGAIICLATVVPDIDTANHTARAACFDSVGNSLLQQLGNWMTAIIVPVCFGALVGLLKGLGFLGHLMPESFSAICNWNNYRILAAALTVLALFASTIVVIAVSVELFL